MANPTICENGFHIRVFAFAGDGLEAGVESAWDNPADRVRAWDGADALLEIEGGRTLQTIADAFAERVRTARAILAPDGVERLTPAMAGVWATLGDVPAAALRAAAREGEAVARRDEDADGIAFADAARELADERERFENEIARFGKARTEPTILVVVACEGLGGGSCAIYPARTAVPSAFIRAFGEE